MKLKEFKKWLSSLPVHDSDIAFIKKLVAIAEAIKNERKSHDDCYCDCNSGSCPCLPCSARMAITDLALENLERE